MDFNYNSQEKRKENTMRKVYCLGLLVSFVLFLHSNPLLCQTAEEILENMIKAQGGRDSLEKILDTTLKGTMEMIQMGLGGTITTYQKEPNKLRMDAMVQGTVVTQAFDGQTAWMTNPMTGMVEIMPEPMTKDFARSALGNDALLNPGKYEISYTMEGKESLNGRLYYILGQNFADGFKVNLFIDSESFLMYKTENKSFGDMGEEIQIKTIFSDYKEFNGITLAHKFVTYQDDKEFMKMEIHEVQMNTGLEDSLFQMNK